ncbi:cytochrome b [Algirhabdus cladophorae]|uniref:cytochrome b n=1 Tax=Algirhabdus cladophorae TaxID=3377108 RepID=UPI003B848959
MKYSFAQKTYHLLTATLIVIMAFTGMAYSNKWLDASTIVYHQYAGQALLIVLVLRVATKFARKSPVARPSGIEHLLASGVHLALYGVLIAYVTTGYVSASGLRTPALLFPVDMGFARSDMGETLLEIHFLLKWVLMAVLGLHIAGALKHLVLNKPNDLVHMSFSSPTVKKD